MHLTQKTDLPLWDVTLFPERTPSDFASPSSELLLLLLEADLAELARLRCAIRRSVLSWGRDGREVERSTCLSAQQNDMITLGMLMTNAPTGRRLQAEPNQLQCPAHVYCIHQAPACCALQASLNGNSTQGSAGRLQMCGLLIWPLCRQACTHCSPASTRLHLCTAIAAAPPCTHVRLYDM